MGDGWIVKTAKAKRNMAKHVKATEKKHARKVTTKTLPGGVKVVTNPPFTTDEETPLPQFILNRVDQIAGEILSLVQAGRCEGIAIGRARATKSGVRRGKA